MLLLLTQFTCQGTVLYFSYYVETNAISCMASWCICNICVLQSNAVIVIVLEFFHIEVFSTGFWADKIRAYWSFGLNVGFWLQR